MEKTRPGVFIANQAGFTDQYSMVNFQKKGKFFVGDGVEVYEGMIVGESAGEKDMVINVTRGKHHSAIHVTTGAQDKVVLAPPQRMEIEDAIGYVSRGGCVASKAPR